MGLDMYLMKKHYVGNKYRSKEEQVKVEVPVVQKDVLFKTSAIKNERVTEIKEEVAYWRKENAIHNWFVANVQDGVDDCHEYYVTAKLLRQLADTCGEAIAASTLVAGRVETGKSYSPKTKKWTTNYEEGKVIEDASVAAELLPTGSGFFFGSTDYNEWYLKGLEYTKTTIEALLQEGEGDYYYQSSW